MENQHLTYFKVENFKKFDSLEVKDIGQFNLIVGDNNVGKTCLLEALLIVNPLNTNRSVELLHYSLCRRKYHIHVKGISSKNPSIPSKNYFEFIKKNKENKRISFYRDDYNLSFEDISLNELVDLDFSKEKKHNYNVGRPEYWIKIFEKQIYKELQFMYLDDFISRLNHGYLPLISMGAGFDRDINNFYAETIGLQEGESLKILFDDSYGLIQSQVKELSLEEKKEFIDNMKLFFTDIQDIMIRSYEERDILSIKLERHKDYLPLTYFGDGTNIFVRCLFEILKNKGQKLLIDEFGEGVHHSKLENFCKIIMQVALKNDVQLFATTHSEECIKAFYEASKELKLKEKIRLISLEEGEEKIYSSTYNFENIEAGLYSNIELRA